MKERIQKILSERGVASRRKAEEMILAGRIACNGQICTLGQQADPVEDTITIDGVPLPAESRPVYIMLHKPRDYVTTLSDERDRKNVTMLVDCGCRVYPVGRLDMDSEGLLLLTNDGDFANAMMHPKHEVRKTYRVLVSGYHVQALEQLRQPVTLDGYTIRPPEVAVEHADAGKASILVTIHEGRNRQVRRMCAMAGLTVRRLIRIREGKLTLGDLKIGRWRYLSPQELQDCME